MKVSVRMLVHLVIAVGAGMFSYWSVLAARIPIEIAPVAKGEPAQYFASYDGKHLASALVLAAVAGIFLVLAVSRGVRDHRTASCSGTPQGYDGSHGDH